MQATIVCAPALAVTSARFPFAARTLWIAARDADAARYDTFFPLEQQDTTNSAHPPKVGGGEGHIEGYSIYEKFICVPDLSPPAW